MIIWDNQAFTLLMVEGKKKIQKRQCMVMSGGGGRQTGASAAAGS